MPLMGFQEDASKAVVLRVKDNDLGMSKTQLRKLFIMFQRFHNYIDGTGIGLFMVKRIIDNA